MESFGLLSTGKISLTNAIFRTKGILAFYLLNNGLVGTESLITGAIWDANALLVVYFGAWGQQVVDRLMMWLTQRTNNQLASGWKHGSMDISDIVFVPLTWRYASTATRPLLRLIRRPIGSDRKGMLRRRKSSTEAGNRCWSAYTLDDCFTFYAE